MALKRGPDGEILRGSRGAVVGEIQRQLQAAGFYLEHEVDNGYGKGTVKAITQFQNFIGLEATGEADRPTMKALRDPEFARLFGERRPSEPHTVSEPSTAAEVAASDNKVLKDNIAAARTLTEDDMLHMIDIMSVFEGKPWSTNKDAEFGGWFDRPKRDDDGDKLHPRDRAKAGNHRPNGFSQYGKDPGHVGLSWGFIQFTQDAGTLGKVLQAAFDKDARAFSMAFDGASNAQAVLRVTNAVGKKKKVKDADSPTGYARRSPRVQPVNGRDLWKSPWVEMFQKAGHLDLFQWAQKKIAVDLYFKSMLRRSAIPYGIKSQKGLTILVDRTVQLGGGGCAKLLKQHWKGGNEEAAFEALYKKIKSRSWAHRMEKLIATDKLSWDRTWDIS